MFIRIATYMCLFMALLAITIPGWNASHSTDIYSGFFTVYVCNISWSFPATGSWLKTLLTILTFIWFLFCFCMQYFMSFLATIMPEEFTRNIDIYIMYLFCLCMQYFMSFLVTSVTWSTYHSNWHLYNVSPVCSLSCLFLVTSVAEALITVTAFMSFIVCMCHFIRIATYMCPFMALFITNLDETLLTVLTFMWFVTGMYHFMIFSCY